MSRLPLLVYIAFLLVFFACGDMQNRIPYVPINHYESTSNLLPGEWDTLAEGYRGVIVYRNGFDTFSVYERACTFEPSNSCEVVTPQQGNTIGVDACCGSQFLLNAEGQIIQGPAQLSLLQYNYAYANEVIHIYN